MPAIEITDAKGLIQVTGTGVTSTSAVTVSGDTGVTGVLTLGDTAQVAGVLTANYFYIYNAC